MSQIEKITALLQSRSFSQEELINLHNNALNYKDISDVDRETISALIEKRLRVKFPGAAKKIFGAKDTEARETLSRFYEAIETEFDLSANKLKNGLKTGGNVISGEAYLYTYISFKNAENIGAHLALSQHTVENELKVIVHKYKTGGDNSGTLDHHEFGIEKLAQAESIYRDYLSQIID